MSEDNLRPFFKRKNELTVENDCILLGNKTVIPKSLQNDVLRLLQHNGIVRSKMLMRSYCWWPNKNLDTEKYIASYNLCQQCQNVSNPNSTLSQWPRAPYNFFRMHIGFLNKFRFTFLLVDQKSKWLEVILIKIAQMHQKQFSN